MQYHNHRPIPYFQFEWHAPGQRHLIFTRQGGVSQAPFNGLNLSSAVADSREHIDINRERAYGLLGHKTNTLVHAHLVHGAAVARVSRAQHGIAVGPVDGLITNDPACGLTMNYADCAGIFLYDPVNRAIGLGHAGWGGTVRDLPGAMVGAMGREFGSNPAQLFAGIGPAIGPCCYEVGEPVIGLVEAAFGGGDGLLIPQKNGPRPHFDLSEANRRNLARAGVESIEVSGLCTACRTDLFFSHRAEKGRTGRFGVMLTLAN